MRIGIDCLHLDPSFVGGLNTFTLGLLEGFAGAPGGHTFRLFCRTGNQQAFEPFRSREGFEIVVVNDREYWFRLKLARLMLLSFSERFYEFANDMIFRPICEQMDRDVDLVYTPSQVLRYFHGKKPSVLSMHDLLHVQHPEFFGWARKLSRRITFNLSARRATFFQASSEFIRQEFLRHFDSISPERIGVIRDGVLLEHFAQPVDTSFLPLTYKIPDRFLLYPAQHWRHKNHMTLLRALQKIEISRGLQIPLVLTGTACTAKAAPVLNFVKQHSMSYVHYLGKVPALDLVALYQKAAYLVMPSLYESNSLPILEAAAAGTAIIASNIPPNQELGRIFQLNLFEPQDSGALATLILELWHGKPEVALAQVRHNRVAITAFSWQKSAQEYLQVFEQVIKSAHGLSE